MLNTNISIRYKLLLSFITISLFILPMSFYILTKTNKITSDFTHIVDYSFPRLQALLEMRMAALQVTSFVNHFNSEIQGMVVNENTPTKIGASKDIMLAYLGDIEAWQTFYQNHITTQDANILNLPELSKLRDNVVLSALESFKLIEHQSSPQNEGKARKSLKTAQEKLERFIRLSFVIELDALLQKENFVVKQAKKAVLITLLLNALIFFIGIAISLTLTTLISKPIIQLKDFALSINQENLDQQFSTTSKDEIGQLAVSINKMLENLSKAKTQLIEASRIAGNAEVATSILHNVGNVLNSLNTASSIMMETLNRFNTNNLEKLYSLLILHKENLPAFFQTEQAKYILPYLEKISKQLQLDNTILRDELKRLIENLQHVNNVINMQQNAGNNKGIIEMIILQELIQSALTLNENKIKQFKIKTTLSFENIPPIKSVKAKLQQILINLIKNAIEALAESENSNKTLNIKLAKLDKKIHLSVTDNGIGIKEENIDKIFSFGFTTKSYGHGYGIHHSAIIATELGGKLIASSEGINKGATFLLEIPYPNTM